MPRQDLPMNPGRMLEFGEYPDPVNDAASVPRAIPVSKAPEDRGGIATPIDVISIATTSTDVRKIRRDQFSGVANLPDDNLNKPF